MSLGLRSILLLVAVVFFVIVALSPTTGGGRLLPLGFAAFAAAFLVGDLPGRGSR